jgi:alkanesulfonate monooxygenase SsuD/methylene tetrahydromethanopterin reductase-like flavin-dependent oxidoreductase (luciferase family)
MGDRTVRVTAELADGWFPLFVARDQVVDRTHSLRKDREAAGLRTEPLTVVAGPVTVAADDAAEARRISASCIAWYLSAMGDLYARFVTEQGSGVRSRPSSTRTRIPVPTGASSPPRHRSSSTSSPSTARQARSATSWPDGTARSTWR